MEKSKTYRLGTAKDLIMFSSIEDALSSTRDGVFNRPTYIKEDLHVAATKVNDLTYGAKITANIRAVRDGERFCEKFLVLNNARQIDQHIFISGNLLYSNIPADQLLTNGNYVNLFKKSFNYAEGNFVSTAAAITEDPTQIIKDTVFCCLPTAGHLLNFGCWLTQIIPQFAAAYSVTSTPRFAVSGAKNWYKNLATEFFGETFNLEILDFSKTTLYKKIIIPLGFSAFKLSGDTLNYFNSFFKKYEDVYSPKKIYISREKHNLKGTVDITNHTRKFINELELINRLRDKGFHVIEPENLSYLEMFKYMYNATHIISPGGANLFNAVACRAGTKIVDIEIGDWGRHHAVLLSSLKLDYSIYVGQPIDVDYKGPQPNFKINIDDFLGFVSAAINAFDELSLDKLNYSVDQVWKHLADNKFLPYGKLKENLDRFLPEQIPNNLLFENQTALKLVLKTKNESALLEQWLLYHSALVGWENIVVIDNQSDEPATLAIYEKYKEFPFILLSYSGASVNLLHDIEFNAQLYKRLIAGAAKFVMLLDTDEYITYFNKAEGCFDFTSFLSELHKIENRGHIYGSLWIHNTPTVETLKNANFNDLVDFELNPWHLSKNISYGKSVVSTHSDVWDKERIRTTVNLGHNTEVPGAKMLNGLWLLHLNSAFVENRIKNNLSMLKARNTCTFEEHRGIREIDAADINKLEELLNTTSTQLEKSNLFTRLRRVEYHKLKEILDFLEDKEKFLQSTANYNSHYVMKTNVIQHTINTSAGLYAYARYGNQEISLADVSFIFIN